MVLKRALMGTTLGTALGLSLAGCAMDTASRESAPPAAIIAQSNRAVAASFATLSPAAGPNTGMQVASLDPILGSTASEVTPPVIQKGTVLWRRDGDESELTPTPKVSEELSRLRESLQQIQGQTSQQMSALESRLQTSQQTLAEVRADQARQENELRSQTVAAVSNVTALAQQSLQTMASANQVSAERWNTTNQQLNGLENRLQTAMADIKERQTQAATNTQAYTDLKVSQAQLETQLTAIHEARQAATEAEQRVASSTGKQIAELQDRQTRADANTQAYTDLKVSQSQLQSQLTAVQEARREASAAEQRAREYTGTQVADLRKLNEENRALASSEVTNVAAALRIYADTQLQQASATNTETIASLAKATNQSLGNLSDQTNRRLGVIWQAANSRAEQLAEEKANSVAASLVALQQQTAAQRITPEQIRSISEQTVAESTPEFRAIAMRSMQESQDYIRSIARSAVQDKDPGMTAALTDAARNVITKDDQVVFAIRKAVSEQLHGIATGEETTAAAPAVRLGPDHERAVSQGSESVELDPNRIRIAQLLSPGSNLPATDAAGGTDLANISPASGPMPQPEAITTGQQSWSVSGTSLVRPHNRADWMDLRQYKVVVHEDDQTLEQLLSHVLKRSEPFTGPWQVRWKISDANKDVMNEKFSLDAETKFEDFVSYLAQYVVNDRGVKLSFSLFDNERIIVISD